MRLRIVHEPWRYSFPFVIEVASDDAAGWSHLQALASEVAAREYMERYAEGGKVIAEWSSEPAAESPATSGPA